MYIGRMRRLVYTMCAVVLLSGLQHFPGKVEGLNVLVTSTGSSSRVDLENDLSRSDPAFSLQKNILGTRRRLRTPEPVEPSEAADEEEVADQELIPPTWKRETEGEKKAGEVTERNDDMAVVDVATEDSGDVSVPSTKGGAVDGRDADEEGVSSIEHSRAKAGTKSASVSRTSEKDGDGMASTSTSAEGEQSEEEAAGADSDSLTSPPTTKKRKKKGSPVVKDTVTDGSDGNLDPALLPESKGTPGKVDFADESSDTISDTISGAKVPRTVGATKSGQELEVIDVEGGEEGPSKNSSSKGEIPDPDPEQAADEDSTVSKPDSKVESLGGVEEAGGAEDVGAVEAGKGEAMEEEEKGNEEEPVKKTSWLWTAGKKKGKGKGKKGKKGTGAESMAAAAAAAEAGDFEAEEGVSPPSGSLSKSGSNSGRAKGDSGEGAQSKEEGKEGAVSAAPVVEGGEDTEGGTFETRTKPKGSKQVKDGDVDPAAEEAQETPGGPDGDGIDAESGTPAGGLTPSETQKGKEKGKQTKKAAAEAEDTDVEGGQEETDLGKTKKKSVLKSKKGGRKEGPLGMGEDDSGFANAEALIGSEGVIGFVGSPGTGPAKESELGGEEGLDDEGVAGGGGGVEESFLGEPTASKVVPNRTFVNAPSSGNVSEKEKSHSNPAQSPTALISNDTKNPSLPEGADSMASATPPRKRRGEDRKRRGGAAVAGGESPAPALVPEGELAGALISPPSPSENWGLDSEFSADPGPPPGSHGSRESSTNTSVPKKKGGLGTPSSLYSAYDKSKSKPGTAGGMFEGASEGNFDPLYRGSSPSRPVDSESSPRREEEGTSERKEEDAGVSGGGKKGGHDFPFGEEGIPDTDDSPWAGGKPKADISGLGGKGGPIGNTVPQYEPGTKPTTTEVTTPVLKNGEEAPGKADFLAAASKVEEERGGGGGGSYTTFLQKYMYGLMVFPVEAALAPYLTLTQSLYVSMALLLLMAAGGCYCWCTVCGRGGGRHGPGYRYDELELGGGGDGGRMSSKDLSVAFGQGEAHNGKWDDSWDEGWEAEAARKKKSGSESTGVPGQDSVGTTSIYELKKGGVGTSPSAKKKGAGSKLVVTKGKPVVDEEWEKEWE